jgi:hypothetical protein
MTDNRKRVPPVGVPRIPIEGTNATREERLAAIAELIALAKREGWHSDGPYGPRDELYDQ